MMVDYMGPIQFAALKALAREIWKEHLKSGEALRLSMYERRFGAPVDKEIAEKTIVRFYTEVLCTLHINPSGSGMVKAFLLGDGKDSDNFYYRDYKMMIAGLPDYEVYVLNAPEFILFPYTIYDEMTGLVFRPRGAELTYDDREALKDAIKAIFIEPIAAVTGARLNVDNLLDLYRGNKV